ncbi:MAG: hypothetical protein WC614_11665 [bacterium]
MKKHIIYLMLFLLSTALSASAPDTLWTRTYGGINSDEGCCVCQTEDSNFIIAGSTNSFGAGKSDIYVIKVDLNGDTIWTKTYGGISNDYGEYICPTADNGFIITGYTGYTRYTDYDSTDVCLIKIDGNGDTLWTRTYGGTGDDEGYSVQPISGGTDGFIIAGWTKSFGAGSRRAYLIRTNSSGDTLWTRIYGESGDRAHSVSQNTDGGFIIGGDAYCRNGDAYIIRTDSVGVPSGPEVLVPTAEIIYHLYARLRMVVSY